MKIKTWNPELMTFFCCIFIFLGQQESSLEGFIRNSIRSQSIQVGPGFYTSNAYQTLFNQVSRGEVKKG